MDNSADPWISPLTKIHNTDSTNLPYVSQESLSMPCKNCKVNEIGKDQNPEMYKEQGKSNSVRYCLYYNHI